MSKMSELAAVLDDLTRIGKALAACGEDLIRTAARVRDCFPGDDGEKPTEQKPAESEPAAEPEEPAAAAVPLEEVRALLAEKSIAGHRAEVQSLIREFGADKLSAVDPRHYAALRARAEVL